MEHFSKDFTIWGMLLPAMACWKFMGGIFAAKMIFMPSSSCLVFYYEVFLQLKTLSSAAPAPRTLPCGCGTWVFNKYYLMIRLNLGMTFSQCV